MLNVRVSSWKDLALILNLKRRVESGIA